MKLFHIIVLDIAWLEVKCLTGRIAIR